MSRQSLPVVLSEMELSHLEQWIRAGSTPQQVVLRARTIRSAAAGQSDKIIATGWSIRRETAALWRRRVREQGIGCVWEIASGRGRQPRYAAAQVGRWIKATLQTKPEGATHWSTRSLARPHFLEKLTDVVGVYLTPPQNAVVLCVDEKSQIQALDRTQPGLPLKPGRCGTYTHDYHRHGATTLFAALQVAEGRVIGQCHPRHRHQEFLKFLRRLDDEFPSGKELHLILDNYGTHGHPRVRRWVAASSSFRPALYPHQFQLAELGHASSANSNKRLCGAPPFAASRVAAGHRHFPERMEHPTDSLRLDSQG